VRNAAVNLISSRIVKRLTRIPRGIGSRLARPYARIGPLGADQAGRLIGLGGIWGKIAPCSWIPTWNCQGSAARDLDFEDDLNPAAFENRLAIPEGR
jgi:hypothetical protein